MPTVEEQVKDGFEKVQKDFSEFKESNDKRLEKIEKNKGTADLDEKLAKMDKAIEDGTKEVDELKTAMGRIGGTESDPEAKTSAEQKELASKAVHKLMRKQALNEEEVKAYNDQFTDEYKKLDEYKFLSVNSEADGGLLVRPEVATDIKKKVFESSPMRQLADVMTIGSDSFEQPYDHDEPGAAWVGETETRAETDSNQLKMIRIFAHEMYAEPRATTKLLEDAAINIEAWHGGKVSEKFGRLEATGFISGSGVGQPRGIVSYTSGDGFDQIQQVNSGSSGAFTADGLIELQDALLEDFQMNATWLMKRASKTLIRKLKNADGSYLWSFDPIGGLNKGPQEMLLGKPIMMANDIAAASANSLSAAYGDFRQGYKIVDRIGISILRDPYTTKGFVKFHTRKRTGGGVQQFQAIKLQKLAV